MVAISHRHKFIFLKTRKTGGTSVEMALEPLCRPPGSTIVEKTPALISAEGIIGRRLTPPPGFPQRLWRTDWYNHMTADQVRKVLGEEKWASYRKLTCVRNPFNAAVSMFYWRLGQQKAPEPRDFDDARSQFRAWLRATPFESSKPIVHSNGQFVADTVIRFETIAADTDAAYHLFDPAAGPISLPHTKEGGSKRKKQPASEYFDRASTEAILKSSAWVFDRFGYSQDPAEAGRPSLTAPETSPASMAESQKVSR